MDAPPEHRSFDAFLAYASRPDRRLARRTEAWLERFYRLAPTDSPLRQLRICRDGSDFELTESSTTYLLSSEKLIVLCSPGAAASEHVARECRTFLAPLLAAGVSWQERVIPVVTSGPDPRTSPRGVFPGPLVDAGLRGDSIWIEFRSRHFWRRRWRSRDYDEERLRLAAEVYGVPPEALSPIWFRERRRQLRLRGALASLVAIALAGLTALSLYYQSEAEANAALAQRRAQDSRSRELAARADRARERDPLGAAELVIESLRVAPERTPAPEVITTSWEVLEHCGGTPIASHGRLAFSPDESLLAQASDELLLWSLTDTETSPMSRIPLDGAASGLVFVNSGRLFVATAVGGYLVETSQGANSLVTRVGSSTIRAVGLIRETEQLVTIEGDSVVLRAGDSGRVVTSLDLADEDPDRLTVPPSCQCAFVRTDTGILRYTFEGGVREESVAQSGWPAIAYAAESDGSSVALVVSRSLVIANREASGRWTSSTVAELGELDIEPWVTWRGDDPLFAVGDDAGGVHIIELGPVVTVQSIEHGHQDDVTAGAFRPDTTELITTSADRTVRIWDSEDLSRPPKVLTGHRGVVWRVAVSADGRRAVTADQDGQLFGWSLAESNLQVRLSALQENPGSSLAISQTGGWVAAVDWHGNARLWNMEVPWPESANLQEGTGGEIGCLPSADNLETPPIANGRIASAYGFPQGNYVMTRDGDGLTSVWHRGSQAGIAEEVWRDDAPSGQARLLAPWHVFVERPDGRFLLDLSISPPQRIWLPTYDTDSVAEVCVSSDNRFLRLVDVDDVERELPLGREALLARLNAVCVANSDGAERRQPSPMIVQSP